MTDLDSDSRQLPDSLALRRRHVSSLRRAMETMQARMHAVLGWFSLPEEETSRKPLERLVVATPPWLASLIVHFSLMILLALLVLETHRQQAEPMAVEVELAEPVVEEEIYAETLGEQLDDPTQLFSSAGELEGPAAVSPHDLPTVADPLAGLPVIGEPTGHSMSAMPTGTFETPAIGLALTGREAGVRQALVKAYGGTALTQDAVDEGLRWLVRRQRRDGMWSLIGPYDEGAHTENEEAATAMALLAFQGAGHTPQSSEEGGFKRAVTRGWRALLGRQKADGHFFGDVATGHRLYTQAQCTIALCELCGMTRDETYRAAAQRAVDYAVKIQSPEGGWRYEPGVDSDTSVTGWFVMALQSARMAGIEVPSPTFERLSGFLDTVAGDEGSKYAYRARDGATLSLTAEGLLCRQYLGWEHDDSRLRDGVDFLLANLPAWDERNVYYWYYGTQVCHHMEGNDWQRWNGITRQLLPEHQVKRGPDRGSWDPSGDRWGDAGGRLYVTCLSLYILEVYYRHLPIYQNALAGRTAGGGGG